MDYGIKLESLLVTTLILLGLAKSQFEPDSPCPNIFKYERDSSGRWYGSISAPNPHPNPVQYRLDFPSSVPLPLIKDIVINENVVCRGNKPNSRILTTLMIQHEIFNDKCDSSSLQCPYNSISQLGGTVGGGIGGGDGGGGGGGGGFDGGGGLPTIDNSPAPMVVDSGFSQPQSMPPASGYVCSDIFSYQQDRSGEWYGLIRVPNPYPVGNGGNLELVNDLKSEWRRMRTGEQYSIPYRLTFPRQFPLPTLKVITANDEVLCRGSRPDAYRLTTMSFQHDIYHEKCTTSSLSCPYNIDSAGHLPLAPQTTKPTKPPPWIPKPTIPTPKPPPPTHKPPPVTPTPPREDIPSPPRNPNPQSSGAQCGNPIIKTNPLAYYGKETQKGQWPWHAAIFHYEGFDTKYVCGGTFIGTRSILTAAHCVTISGKPREPSQLIVHLGRYNLTDRREIKEAQDIEVNYLLVHPLFNHTKLQADVAILVLQSTVKVTDMVKPACLWNFQDTSLTNIVGEKGVVVGWGQDENGKTAEELKMVVMPVVDSQICIWSNPTFFSQFTSNTTFCAGFRNGTSVCNGDSGGGLVLPRTQSDGTVIWMLRGIVSSSKARENAGKICDTKNYVIFMDVAKLLDWINAVFI
ncbi:hypothetical protein C0J52_20888 [Blattella germanica]|nr:hypothetical protein C0J52_20888 [Blattella germanica]